jgi:hypothetical protein
MKRKSEGLAQSVQTRLVRHAHDTNVDPNLVMARFASERFLYRLSRSPYVERFVLKGALLLAAWLGETIRPTRDADLLGFGDLSDAEAPRPVRFEDVRGRERPFDQVDPLRLHCSPGTEAPRHGETDADRRPGACSGLATTNVMPIARRQPAASSRLQRR